MTQQKIAYVLAEFPSFTETFVAKEILYINESFPLYIFVLKKGECPIEEHVQKTLKNNIIYVPSWTSWKILPFVPRAITSPTVWRNARYGLKEVIHQMKAFLVSFYITQQAKLLRIQHIHAHFANYPTEIAILVSRFSGIPYSFTAHANDIYVDSNKLPEKIKHAAFVTTCTKYNKNWLDALVIFEGKHKIHLIYHGVDLDNWQYRQPCTLKFPTDILAIGRLIEKKGFIFLLEAVKILIEKGIPVRLRMVGKGKDEQKLKRYCQRHKLEEIVTFLGWQNADQIKHLYACSDIFVLPSIISVDGDRDGIPNVVLEAMATGVPVISTPISGIPEVIQHEHNGLLIPEKDSIRLAQAISTLINNHALRTTYAENARYFVEEHFDRRQCNAPLKKLFMQQHISTGGQATIHSISVFY